MLNVRESLLQFYSLGIVVEDKKRDSWDIKVCPIEDLTNIEVPLKDYKPEYKVELPDMEGVPRKSQVKGSAVITAKWLPINNSNRVTAPDVIKNETVVIYRYSDSEDYYWNTLFHEPKIRRLETVTHSCGNISSGLSEWNEGSSYYITMSTHDKYYKVRLNKNNGEKSGYTIKIDSKSGTVKISDDEGNYIELNTEANSWTINANKEINLIAPTINLMGTVNISKLGTLFDNEVINKNLDVGGRTNIAKDLNVGGIVSASDISLGGKSLKAALDGKDVSLSIDAKTNSDGSANAGYKESVSDTALSKATSEMWNKGGLGRAEDAFIKKPENNETTVTGGSGNTVITGWNEAILNASKSIREGISSIPDVKVSTPMSDLSDYVQALRDGKI